MNRTELTAHVAEIALAVHRSLYTTQPSWCSFQGVTCGSFTRTSAYAHVMEIGFDSLTLTGTIPSSIGNFQSMTYLHIAGNYLHGSIPSSIGFLTSLVQLSLNANILTGSIPTSIGNLLLLQQTHLSGNSLTGTIPSQFSLLSVLQIVDLHENYLTMGSLTTVPVSTFSDFTTQESISLYDNCFSYFSIGHDDQSATPTRCKPTTGKMLLLCMMNIMRSKSRNRSIRILGNVTQFCYRKEYFCGRGRDGEWGCVSFSDVGFGYVYSLGI